MTTNSIASQSVVLAVALFRDRAIVLPQQFFVARQETLFGVDIHLLPNLGWQIAPLAIVVMIRLLALAGACFGCLRVNSRLRLAFVGRMLAVAVFRPQRLRIVLWPTAMSLLFRRRLLEQLIQVLE